MKLHDFIAMTEKEVDPDKWIKRVEKTPTGVTIIWHQCPVCFKEISDPEGSMSGYEAHLSMHGLKIKRK